MWGGGGGGGGGNMESNMICYITFFLSFLKLCINEFSAGILFALFVDLYKDTLA